MTKKEWNALEEYAGFEIMVKIQNENHGAEKNRFLKIYEKYTGFDANQILRSGK